MDKTIQEAAVILGISKRALQQRVAHGLIKARRVGPIWVIAERELERAKAVGRLKPGPKPQKKRGTAKEQ